MPGAPTELSGRAGAVGGRWPLLTSLAQHRNNSLELGSERLYSGSHLLATITPEGRVNGVGPLIHWEFFFQRAPGWTAEHHPALARLHGRWVRLTYRTDPGH